MVFKKKTLEEYLKEDDFFIYDRTVMSKSGTINHYWHVHFYSGLGIAAKSFNKLLYTKDDAIQFRDSILHFYMKNNSNDEFIFILGKYLKK